MCRCAINVNFAAGRLNQISEQSFVATFMEDSSSSTVYGRTAGTKYCLSLCLIFFILEKFNLWLHLLAKSFQGDVCPKQTKLRFFIFFC